MDRNLNLTNLNIGNINLRSLNVSNVNRNETFNKIDLCLAHNPDILYITETKLHSNDCKLTIEKYLKFRKPCSYLVQFNSTSKSRGVGIIYKSTLNLKILLKISPKDENSLIMKCKLNETEIVLAVVYPPSDAKLDFFNTLKSNIDSTQCCTKIIGGDFNALISPLPPHLTLNLTTILHSLTLLAQILSRTGCYQITWLIPIDIYSKTKKNFPMRKKYEILYQNPE